MIGPYTESADLQIICLFKHKASGDTYQGAAKDNDEHLHGILSTLRNRGEFVGELGETFLFTPPSGSIPAKRFMVIGLGEEKDLSLDSLRVLGRIAAREAVRLEAKLIAWAPVIRDEGNTVLDVGEGDRAFIEQMLSAYDTEKRLQAQALAPNFSIEDLVIEAEPTYFDDAARQVNEGIASMTTELAQRNAAPYSSAKCNETEQVFFNAKIGDRSQAFPVRLESEQTESRRNRWVSLKEKLHSLLVAMAALALRRRSSL